jgi:hypothetical protein
VHTYTFALKYPKNHAANADGGDNKYIVSIESEIKLDQIAPGETREISIEHGVTPAAPTVMTQSDGLAIGDDNAITIESDVINLTFDRDEFRNNPMPWSPTFEGETCEAPIYYECDD